MGVRQGLATGIRARPTPGYQDYRDRGCCDNRDSGSADCFLRFLSTSSTGANVSNAGLPKHLRSDV